MFKFIAQVPPKLMNPIKNGASVQSCSHEKAEHYVDQIMFCVAQTDAAALLWMVIPALATCLLVFLLSLLFFFCCRYWRRAGRYERCLVSFVEPFCHIGCVVTPLHLFCLAFQTVSESTSSRTRRRNGDLSGPDAPVHQLLRSV